MDLMSLTPAELNYAQRKAKLSSGILGVLGDKSHVGWLDAVVALSWVVMRREDQGVKFEDVAEMPITELVEALGLPAPAVADEGDDEGRYAPAG